MVKITCTQPVNGKCEISTNVNTFCWSVEYKWDEGQWSECGSDCYQRRTPLCKRPDGVVVADDRCIYTPSTQQSCSGGACTKKFEWQASEWEQCTNGQQKRSVTCWDTTQHAPFQFVVEDRLCSAQKPETTRQCNEFEYEWGADPWFNCSEE
eukprot:m51a1_g8202 hypothetical protein (152) ;mRNA; r:30632-31298